MFQVNLKTLLVVLAFTGLLTAYFAQGLSLNKYKGFVPVVIAGEDIPAGTKIEKRQLTVQYRQKGLVANDHYSDIAAVAGKTIHVALNQGEPISQTVFAKPKFTDILNPIPIPPGHKVVAVKLKKSASLNNILKPNDTIEIMGQHNWLWGTSSTTIRGLKVFSVGSGRNSQPFVGVLVDEPTSQRLETLTSSAGSVKVIVPTAE